MRDAAGPEVESTLSSDRQAHAVGEHRFVVAASRLPVDRTEGPDGEVEWQPSPGGLVTALEPVMREAGGAWVGWPGAPGEPPKPFDADGMHLVSVGLSAEEVRDYYEGFCNATLWPLYHDVIAQPEFRRPWWDSYVKVNRRYADAVAEQASPGATVWIHDYQLQLVPAMLRELRSDVRIGHFTHIPFPGYEIFAQLPWRRQIVQGLLGADLLGFQRQSDATNFLRACRRSAGLSTHGSLVRVPDPAPADEGNAVGTRRGRPGVDDRTGGREVRAAAFPISIDSAGFEEIARREDVRARAKEIRAALGNPDIVLLGIDRLDYTKGILHRLNAYGEVLNEGRLGLPGAVLVQVASPSRERVEHYRRLRDEVEVTVGRINGEHGEVGSPPVHYLHQSYPREEMAALYLAADVMLVTPLRDGMNLVAKEYIACRYDETGALVLSEFTGAADELGSAFIVNPHDIEGLKDAIVRAATISPREARRRMRSMRRRVRDHDVAYWAATFLDALQQTPDSSRPGVSLPGRLPGQGGFLARAASWPALPGWRFLIGFSWRHRTGARRPRGGYAAPVGRRFETIRTARLVLRRWRDADRDPCAAMNADPDVMRYFPAPLDRAASDASIDRFEMLFDRQGYGLWALEVAGTGEFIGFTGLNPMPAGVPGAGGMEVGWRLARRAWHHGYATEAALAAVDVGFNGAGLAQIWSMTAILNEPSQAVMRRLGMTPYARFEHPKMEPGHPLRPHVVYRLPRAAGLVQSAE